MELSAYKIHYIPRTTIKFQILVEFIAEFTEERKCKTKQKDISRNDEYMSMDLLMPMGLGLEFC